MPANLTADYLAAESAYKRATTREARISALEEMIATLPKHKGTEKMQAALRRRLAEARKESPKKAGAHTAPSYIIRREGAGQVALIGPPNSGKSQLLCSLTHARPDVAAYPFTTRTATPGMARFEDVPFQLIDTPAMSPEFVEPWLPQVIRNADFSILVVDPGSADVLGEIEFALRWLESCRLASPRLLLVNKLDLPGAEENFSALQELYSGSLRCLGIAAATTLGLAAFTRTVFEQLNVVRFYAKPPGKQPDLEAPFILRRGETVQDAAQHVHRDFAERLKYARIFRKSHEHDGFMVTRAHVVEDEDILEFHM